jgi:hypothetical protein
MEQSEWAERARVGRPILFTNNHRDNRLLQVRDYIAENPVKAGLVEQAAAWMFGSLYHRLHRLTSLLDDAVSDVFNDPPLGQV